MELVFVLIAICALLTPGAFSKKRKHTVNVRSELPGYIEFGFTFDYSFQPQSFTATSSGTNKIISFTRTDRSDLIIFRNTEEQYFRIYEDLLGSLSYKIGTELPTNNISFLYTIDEKAKILLLNIRKSAKKFPRDDDNVSHADYAVPASSRNTVNTKIGTDFKLPYEVREQDSVSHIDPSCENLREVLNTALKYVHIGTRLLLSGHKPLDTNAVDVIRRIIGEELKLAHLQNKILQAKFEGDNILFEMSSGEDVLQILTQMRLMPNSFDIILTDANFFNEPITMTAAVVSN